MTGRCACEDTLTTRVLFSNSNQFSRDFSAIGRSKQTGFQQTSVHTVNACRAAPRLPAPHLSLPGRHTNIIRTIVTLQPLRRLAHWSPPRNCATWTPALRNEVWLQVRRRALRNGSVCLDQQPQMNIRLIRDTQYRKRRRRLRLVTTGDPARRTDGRLQ